MILLINWKKKLVTRRNNRKSRQEKENLKTNSTVNRYTVDVQNFENVLLDISCSSKLVRMIIFRPLVPKTRVFASFFENASFCTILQFRLRKQNPWMAKNAQNFPELEIFSYYAIDVF